MKDSILMTIATTVAMTIALPSREEVIKSTPLAVVARPTTAAVEAPDEDDASGASLNEPTPLTEEQFVDLQQWLKSGGSMQEWADRHPDPALTASCPTCKGAGVFHGALCPTCDGAAAATLTKDGVTFSEQGFKPQQAAPTGHWLTVPTYGRFGRVRGYQRVWGRCR